MSKLSEYSGPILEVENLSISFFTKDQAPINSLIDQFYLGWFLRLIFNPLVFSKRYLYSLRLIPMVILSKIKIIN